MGGIAHQQGQGVQGGQQYYGGLGTGGMGEELPDLSALMFPSSDPFAYPAQPVLNTYGAAGGKDVGSTEMNDNTGTRGNGGGGVPATTTYLDPGMTGGTGLFSDPSAGMYGDLEGQIFGPLPGFMMEGGMGGLGMGMGMNGFGSDGMGGTGGEGVVQQVGMVGLGMGGGGMQGLGGMGGMNNMGGMGYEGQYGGEEWGGGGNAGSGYGGGGV